MRVLGISAFYHDSAACLVEDGRIVAAAQEERFSRIKHDPAFPAAAIDACLAEGRCGLDDLDLIVFYEKPFLKFERLLETALAVAPRGYRLFTQALPLWLKERLFQKRQLTQLLEAMGGTAIAARLRFTEHHQAHAASAFFPSGLEQAAILTLDGVGEWATATWAVGEGTKLSLLAEQSFPHSLGLLYSAFTLHAGFKVNSGEYKLMGLAPYGEPRFARRIFEQLIDLKDDGSFRLDLDYFGYLSGLRMTGRRFDTLFDGPARAPEAPIGQRDCDLAASIQVVTEEVVLRMARALLAQTGQRDLCLAGGVALNCVANGRLLRSGLVRQLWIQPAAGDAGGAVGAALAAYFAAGGARQDGELMQGGYLGPGFDDDAAAGRLAAAGAVCHRLSPEALVETVAAALAQGAVVGWMQGRMEFGPRALGNRSILADPRSPDMQRRLNLKIKFRESFRPFAPAVLAEAASQWFALDGESPYMMLTVPVATGQLRPPAPGDEHLAGLARLAATRSSIPAVTHVDGSARVQTVRAASNPRFHALLTAFAGLTGCPVLANTSFNVRGEPIVATPEDALACFLDTEMDLLAVGNLLLRRSEQPAALLNRAARIFAPD